MIYKDSKPPRFRNPPLIETVLGVQFSPIPTFSPIHLGAFWKSLGEDWPIANDAEYLFPQFEKFGIDSLQSDLEFLLRVAPSARIQIRNVDKTRMIQAQNTRFHYNWLRADGAAYPHYEQVLSEFNANLDRFLEFVGREGMASPAPNQWEVTYVNHIQKGTLWQHVCDWPNVFSIPFQPGISCSVGTLESARVQWHFEIEPQRGRLHAEITHARTISNIEVLRFVLTARGPITTPALDFAQLRILLNTGHEAIVKAFFELTSQEAHQAWEVFTE